MKPFLGIDLTTNKKNEQSNGDEFLVVKPSLALEQSLENSLEDAVEIIEKGKLPLLIRIIQWVCGIAGFLMVAGIFGVLGESEDITFTQLYQQAPWLFYLSGICIVLWLILFLIGSWKMQAVMKTEESTQTFSHLDKTSDAIFAEMSVPSDSREIDVLFFYYKEKAGKLKICGKSFQLAPYQNPIFHVYADSENLYFANLEGKYAFPLSSIKTIRSVKKTICIEEWNKDEPFNKGIYKQYKLSENDNGCIICKRYHIIEVEHNCQLWGIYIPCYELPVIEELTGLQAETV